jgi:hypothetical protein
VTFQLAAKLTFELKMHLFQRTQNLLELGSDAESKEKTWRMGPGVLKTEQTV